MVLGEHIVVFVMLNMRGNGKKPPRKLTLCWLESVLTVASL